MILKNSILLSDICNDKFVEILYIIYVFISFWFGTRLSGTFLGFVSRYVTLLETSVRAFFRDRAREMRYPGRSRRLRAFRARSRDALATCQNSTMSFRNGLRRQKRSFVHERARETRTDAQLNRRRFRRNHFHRDKYRRAHFAAAEIKQNAVSTRASIASVVLLINERALLCWNYLFQFLFRRTFNLLFIKISEVSIPRSRAKFYIIYN